MNAAQVTYRQAGQGADIPDVSEAMLGQVAVALTMRAVETAPERCGEGWLNSE